MIEVDSRPHVSPSEQRAASVAGVHPHSLKLAATYKSRRRVIAAAIVVLLLVAAAVVIFTLLTHHAATRQPALPA